MDSTDIIQPEVSKLQPKFQNNAVAQTKLNIKAEKNMSKDMPLIKTTAPQLVTTAPMLLYSVNSTPLSNAPIMYYNALRHQFTTSKTSVKQQGVIILQSVPEVDNKNMNDGALSPAIEVHLSPSEQAIAKSKNIRKYRFGLLPPDKANILAKDLGSIPAKRLIYPSAGKGNDTKYFDKVFPPNEKKTSPILVDRIESSSTVRASSESVNDSIFADSDFDGKIILDTTSQVEASTFADKMLTIRGDPGFEHKYRIRGSQSPTTALYTPASFRLPIKKSRINYDEMSDDSLEGNEIAAAAAGEEVNQIRMSLGLLETDGSIDKYSYDDKTKEEFFQRSKMISRQNSADVEILYLPPKANSPPTISEAEIDAKISQEFDVPTRYELFDNISNFRECRITQLD